MATQSERKVEYRSWTVILRLTVVKDGEGSISGNADLHFAGEHRCRLASTGVLSDPEEMIGQLEAKAKQFIDDWIEKS